MKKFPRVFGFAKEKDWKVENLKIMLLDDHDEDTYKPFYITSAGPYRIWWEWRKIG